MTAFAEELARDWMDRGFRVLPLGANKQPVTIGRFRNGFHDASNSYDDLHLFEDGSVEMVGVVPGSRGCLVLDIDVKGDGPNGFTYLDELEARHGRLSRDYDISTPSGGAHIWLRKPDHTERIGNKRLAPHIDVRADGGYVVAPGNPGYGRWPLIGPPLSIAPAWVMDILRSDKGKTLDTPYSAPEARLEDEWHPKVTEAYNRFTPRHDRHQTMIEAVQALASYELLGLAGSTSALQKLEQWFVVAVSDRADEDEARDEYRRALEGARRRVQSHESTVLKEREADLGFVQAIRDQQQEEEKSFWQELQVLKDIHDKARARMAAPWAVLGAALARTAAAVPPFVTIRTFDDGVIGLNFFVGLVGPSGAGKNLSIDTALALIEYEEKVYPVEPGSAEGLVRQYVRRKSKTEGGGLERLTDSVFFVASEIDTLAAISGREGNAVMSVLRNAWSSADLGFAYADPDKNLRVDAHSYRLSLIVGIQPARAGALLDQADGGTPQRFLWMPVIDPSAPADPDPYTRGRNKLLMPKTWTDRDPHSPPDAFGGFVRLEPCSEALAEIKASRLAVLRGENVDPLEGHALQLQLKTAALLAILDTGYGQHLKDRGEIRSIDLRYWQLAKRIKDKSDEVRRSVQETLNNQKRTQNVKQALARAEQEKIVQMKLREAGLEGS